MTTRVLVSNLLVVRGRVDIEETSQSATDTTMVSATGVVVRGVSRWVMKLRIAGAHDL